MRHVPVLLNEVIEALSLEPGMKVIDCTVGDGGHSEAILEKIGPKGRLLAIDADTESLLNSKRFLYRFSDQIIFVHDNFSNLKTAAKNNNFDQVDGILMDLGWSMSQFKERGRGFSFEKDEALDMRYMNSSGNELTAEKIVNTYSVQDLEKIFRMYGEEKLYKEISQAINSYRKEKEIKTTQDLVSIVLEVCRRKLKSTKEVPWVGGIHPATKVFQAVRIAVNHEFEALEQALPQAIKIMQSGGRLAVITFHSLEDRIVKQFFKKNEHKIIKIITKKPITASQMELGINPASRSAKLRVVQKI